MIRLGILFAAFNGALGVALGAYAAHGAMAALGERGSKLLDTASRYQMIHALALLAVCLLARQELTVWLKFSGIFFAAGICLFCGSLIILAFDGPKFFGAVTPLGGTAFILGWILLGVGAWKSVP